MMFIISVLAGVILHGHVEDELRRIVGLEHMDDGVVRGLVRHHVAELIGVLEVVDCEELVKPKGGVDGLSVPVGAMVGVLGGGGVAQLLELFGEVLGLKQVVDGVRVHAGTQVGQPEPR